MAKQTKKTKPKQDDTSKLSFASGDAFKDVFERATSFSSDFGELARSNVEAMTQSLQVAGKGVQEINAKAFEFMQANFEASMEASRKLSSVKSAEDFSGLQEVTKTGFEAYVAQMNEMGTLFAKTLREATEPLNAQAGVVVEKFQASA